MLPSGDRHLVQIVDAATADAAQRAGSWLKCAPGCTQCCVGVFAISQLDAERLRAGLLDMERTDPGRARAVRVRARDAVQRLAPKFPGNVDTGTLNLDQAEAFEEFANDEPCPALDPATGLCDLYAARPMTCRVFGPPLRTEGGLGVCELCFVGATAEEIAAAEVQLHCGDMEGALTREVEATSGVCGETIVAWALARV